MDDILFYTMYALIFLALVLPAFVLSLVSALCLTELPESSFRCAAMDCYTGTR